MASVEPACSLTVGEKQRLQELVRNGRGIEPAHALIILLSNEEHSASAIARTLGFSVRAVHRLRAAWRDSGLAGILSRPRTGRPPRMTPAATTLLLSVVERDPRDEGLAFTRWTAPRLAQFLLDRTGIGVSPAWVAELLHMHGLVWRQSKLTLRNLSDEGEKKTCSHAPQKAAKSGTHRRRRIRALVRRQCSL